MCKMKDKQSKNFNFLDDLTDGRSKGTWKSFYDKEALREINWERNYLLIILGITFLSLVFFSLFFKKCFFQVKCNIDIYRPYIYSCLGGLLGGTVFSIKWLIHSVAKNFWHIDRRLWRIMTPILSMIIALIINILLELNFVSINMDNGISIYKSFGIGCLSGYFSDNAIGKMTEVAQVLFGGNSRER